MAEAFNSVVEGPKGCKMQMDVLHKNECKRRGGAFQSKFGSKGMFVSGRRRL